MKILILLPFILAATAQNVVNDETSPISQVFIDEINAKATSWKVN